MGDAAGYPKYVYGALPKPSAWPPVADGQEFVVDCPDIGLSAVMKVSAGRIECCERSIECPNRAFGAATTQSLYHCDKHVRTVHVKAVAAAASARARAPASRKLTSFFAPKNRRVDDGPVVVAARQCIDDGDDSGGDASDGGDDGQRERGRTPLPRGHHRRRGHPPADRAPFKVSCSGESALPGSPPGVPGPRLATNVASEHRAGPGGAANVAAEHRAGPSPPVRTTEKKVNSGFQIQPTYPAPCSRTQDSPAPARQDSYQDSVLMCNFDV